MSNSPNAPLLPMHTDGRGAEVRRSTPQSSSAKLGVNGERSAYLQSTNERSVRFPGAGRPSHKLKFDRVVPPGTDEGAEHPTGRPVAESLLPDGASRSNLSKRGLVGACVWDFPAVTGERTSLFIAALGQRRIHAPTKPHLLTLPGGLEMVTTVQFQCIPGPLFSLIKRSVLTFFQYRHHTGQPPTAHFIR